MANPLPVKALNHDAAALAERQTLPQVFDMITNPAKYGISWPANHPYQFFLTAVDRGFVPNTVEGLETLTAWSSEGNLNALKAGQFEFVAYSAHFNGVPLDTVARAAKGWPAEYAAALEAEYGQPLPDTKPIYQPVPPAARRFVDQTDLVLTKSTTPFRPGLPTAPGDGIHFPVIAWRIRTIAQGGGEPTEISFSPFVRYGQLVVNRLSSETAISEFIEDMTPQEIAEVLAAPQGGPPPLATVDTIAAPDSTSFAPKTQPIGTASPNLPAPQIQPPVQSGTPAVKPWTDAAPPPEAPVSAVGNAPADSPVAGSGGSDPAPSSQGVLAGMSGLVLAALLGLAAWLLSKRGQ